MSNLTPEQEFFLVQWRSMSKDDQEQFALSMFRDNGKLIAHAERMQKYITSYHETVKQMMGEKIQGERRAIELPQETWKRNAGENQ